MTGETGCSRGIMIRLDLSYFYRLAMTFENAKRAPVSSSYRDVWAHLYEAERALEALFADTQFRNTYRRALGPANLLHTELKALREGSWDAEFGPYDRARIATHIDQFSTVLISELSVADAYYVVQKRGLDTESLVSQGELLFPTALASKVPQAVDDLREAGKCIAFELCTAAGFHLMRALEVVLRRYWEVQTGNQPKPKQRNIGTYIRGLKKAGCGDEKVLAALLQLKDLHRNVITHTEEFLSVDKAISLQGMTRSVVDAMLDSIPDIEAVAPPPDDESFPPTVTSEEVSATLRVPPLPEEQPGS